MYVLTITILSVFSLSGCGKTTNHASSNYLTPEVISVPQRQQSEITFERTEAGRRARPTGEAISFQEFKASDGVWLSTEVETYKSPDLAIKELQTRIKEAVNIIERKPLLDEKGTRMGERVVAQFASIENHPPYYAVIWATELNLRTIASPSLKHIEEFEKWLTVDH